MDWDEHEAEEEGHVGVVVPLVYYLVAAIICFVVILLVSLISSCAPMPGNTLFEGLDQPTPIEDIKITKTVGVWETTAFCNSGMEAHVVALNCLFNACIVMGCADIRWNEEGEIYSCDIYVAYDWDWLVDHEMRHCLGYADVLY